MEKIWLKQYPQGVAPEIHPDSYHSIYDVYEEAIRKFSSRIAYTNLDTDLTFQDLALHVDAFASFLTNELRLQKGDRIALQMPNLLQFPVALFGAIKAGLVVVNTNPLYTAKEMEHQFKDSGAKAILILANYAHLLESILPQTAIESIIVTEVGDLCPTPKRILVNAIVKHLKKMVPSYHLPQAYGFRKALKIGSQHGKTSRVPLHGSDIAFLQYTGGTTGVSKGAILTHRNVIANMLQIFEWVKPKLREGEEIVLTALPMYHIFSLTLNCLALLRYGAQNILITNPRDIPAFIKIMQKYPFTVMSGVNTLFNALMNHPQFSKVNFSKVKVSVAGAMALQRVVCERWQNSTKSLLVEGYGLTEASPVVCCNPIDGTDRTGTIGLPLPSTNVGLFDEGGQLITKIDEPGELCLQGPQVMKGYWKRPDETDKVINSEGWLKTGDVATMDKDGFFKIVDRKKDMIIVSGFNVYPNEIENVIASHPGVLEVAAIGSPDAHSGETVKIVVVKKDPSLTEQDLIAHAKISLTGYKIPKIVEFRTELPKTNVGKVLRRALR